MAISAESINAIPVCLVVLFGTEIELLLAFASAVWMKRWQISAFTGTYIGNALLLNILKAGFILFFLLQIARFVVNLQHTSTTYDDGDFPAKPMFFTCETGHSRFFPKKNSFIYSYLLTGIPIGWKGSSGGMISADVRWDQTPWYRRLFSFKPTDSWWTVHGDNYIARGTNENGLRGKLDEFLQKEGLDPKDFPYAYLFTAAKFAGYSSNPVSFWNLYSESKVLVAIMLEVNNTFDERHFYYLVPSATKTIPKAGKLRSDKYRVTFTKELFVSPFNRRNEFYKATTSDCLFPAMTGTSPLDSTIVLYDPDGRPKVSARIWSTGSGIDPTKLSIWQKACFIWSWWWVGFATIPRTLAQAYSLSKVHRLPFTFSPEPKDVNLERLALPSEIAVEKVFRAYLEYMVEHLAVPVRITYSPAGIPSLDEVSIFSSPAKKLLWETPEKRGEVKQLRLRVLSPTLYSRLLYYGFCSISHILLQESQLLNQTVNISDNQLFGSLFTPACSTPNITIKSIAHLRWYERWAIRLLEFLTDLKEPAPFVSSCEREDDSQETTNKQLYHQHHEKSVHHDDIDPSFMTCISFGHCSPRRAFLWHAVKLRIVPYVALNSPMLFDTEIFILRCVGSWLAIRLIL